MLIKTKSQNRPCTYIIDQGKLGGKNTTIISYLFPDHSFYCFLQYDFQRYLHITFQCHESNHPCNNNFLYGATPCMDGPRRDYADIFFFFGSSALILQTVFWHIKMRPVLAEKRPQCRPTGAIQAAAAHCIRGKPLYPSSL